MISFLLQRLWQTLIVLIGAALVIFTFVRLAPGDPIEVMFDDVAITPEQREELARQLGFDKPLPYQFVVFLVNLLQGDLGVSLRQNVPVTQLIAAALPNTIELTVASIIVAILIATPIAIVSALKQNSFWDRSGTVITLFGMSMPTFWQAILLIMLFSVSWQLLPVSGVLDAGMHVQRITGFTSIDAAITGNWDALVSFCLHLALPALTLGSTSSAVIARLLRTNLIEVKRQDFVDALKARGLSRGTVIRHMVRNALPTTVVVFGLRIGALLGGALVIETIFSWPGLGWLLINGISARDYPVVQGVVIVITLLVVMTNLLTDLAQAWLDPRVKFA